MKNIILAAIVSMASMIGGGCASWRLEPVAVKTEVQSLENFELMAPRIYRDRKGYIAVGYLRAKGINAHQTRAHLHALLMDGHGSVLFDKTARMPTVRHNRFGGQETASYSFRLEKAPIEGASLKIVLHEGTAEKCERQPAD